MTWRSRNRDRVVRDERAWRGRFGGEASQRTDRGTTRGGKRLMMTERRRFRARPPAGPSLIACLVARREMSPTFVGPSMFIVRRTLDVTQQPGCPGWVTAARHLDTLRNSFIEEVLRCGEEEKRCV